MVPPTSRFETVALGLSIRGAASEVPHRIALVSEEGFLTFGGLACRVAGVVDELRKKGLEDTQRTVGLVGTTDLETLLRLYALVELGVPVALIHPRFPHRERQSFLAECEAALLDLPLAGTAALETLPAQPPDDEQCLAILRTSGSSGRPKGVVLSRRAFVAAAASSAHNLGWQEEDRWLLSLPVAHVGGLSVLTRCLVARRTVVVAPPGRFEPQRMAAWLVRWRISLLSLVPTMLHRLLDLPNWHTPASLRALLLGGASAPSALLERAAQHGVPVLTTWGLTEACSQVTTQRYARREGAALDGETDCGPPLRGMEVRIREGAIDIRGPQLLSSYLPASGPSPLDAEGWLTTGDTGCLDAQGSLHVFGRRDEVIITGGENVHPQEVESVLLAHPRIEEACVFAVADGEWGQVVAAALASSKPLSEDELRYYVEEHLAPFKRPRRVVWLEELPKTATGKVDRRALSTLNRKNLEKKAKSTEP